MEASRYMTIKTKDGVAKALINESDCTCTSDYSLHMVGKQLRYLGEQFTMTKNPKYKEQGINLKTIAVRMFKRHEALRTANLI